MFLTYSEEEYDRRTWETCKVGKYCQAYWHKNQTWNNAKILRVRGQNIKLKFFNYGKKATVRVEGVVWSPAYIPEGEAVDRHVATIKQSKEIPLDQNCQARWRYDSTWYNAKILAVQRSGIRVKLSHFGNKEWVGWEEVVWSPLYIPEGDLVYGNVKKTAEGRNGHNEVNQDSNNEGVKEMLNSAKDVPIQWDFPSINPKLVRKMSGNKAVVGREDVKTSKEKDIPQHWDIPSIKTWLVKKIC